MTTRFEDLIGRALHARDSRPIGRITAIYRYPADLCAPGGVAAVTTGLLRRLHLVDLEGAAIADGVVTVPHDRQTIISAPSFTPMAGDMLAESKATKVREHYWGAAQPA